MSDLSGLRRYLLAALAAVVTLPAWADVRVSICHGYSCVAQAEIGYSAERLGEIRRLLADANDAAQERERLAEAMGRLYRWAGEQSAVRNDRAGNYADGYVPGKMDCIDHSTSTTRLLNMLENAGMLRWHVVLLPQVRYFLGVFPSHWSAVIEEKDAQRNSDANAGENAGQSAGDNRRFVVDSWFVNNGEPAVILPLSDWKKGAGPDV